MLTRSTSMSSSFISAETIEAPLRFKIVSLRGNAAKASALLGGQDGDNKQARCMVWISVQLFQRQRALTPIIVVNTDTSPPPRNLVVGNVPCSISSDSNAPPPLDINFSDVVELPIGLCDLPLDAQVVCRVYSAAGYAGTAAFHPYALDGQLKTGYRRYTVDADVREDACPPEYGPSTERLELAVTPSWELLERALHDGSLPSIPWLDGTTQRHLCTLRREEAPPSEGGLCMCITLPSLAQRLPVRYTQRRSSTDNAKTQGSAAPPVSSRSIYADPSRPWRDANVCEAVAGVLAKSVMWMYDASATPGIRERQRLQEIARRPPIQVEALRVEDVTLMWQYRHFAMRSTQLFIPFMRTVSSWEAGRSSDEEGRVAVDLMKRWKALGVAEALGCLSYLFAGVAPVRQYAVQLLDRETNERLCRLAVPLVQALRYDTDELELSGFLLRRALQHWELCSVLYWCAAVEGAEDTLTSQQPPAQEPLHPAAATPGMPGGASSSNNSGNGAARLVAFKRRFTHVLQDTRSPFMRRLQRQVELHACLNVLCDTLSRVSSDRTSRINFGMKLIERRACGIGAIFSDPAAAADSQEPGTPASTPGSANRRQGSSSRRDTAPSYVLPSEGDEVLDAHSVALLPTHPTVAAQSMLKEAFYIYKSATMPVQVGFTVLTSTSSTAAFAPLPLTRGGGGGGGDGASPSRTDLSLIFKAKEDMRQDQLVMSLIDWMDTLFTQEGLDLCLTPYRVMATGVRDGLVEVVPGVVTIQSVQRDIMKYIRTYNPTSEKLRRAMDRYTRSFAGYCVITYVLGVGDRHLENMLLARDGRLLHIDFGYILGNDPKPFPPPMKINREMVEALGGPQSTGYTEFKGYCCSAYNILRNNAAFLLHFMQLMVHADGMPQLTGSVVGGAAGGGAAPAVDARANVVKVQEKLRLDLTNAQATQFLQNVIADSVGSIFTGLWDVLHAAAQATRV